MNFSVVQNVSPKELDSWIKGVSKVPFLIDVREQNELLVAPFPYHSLHLPLSEAKTWVDRLPELLPLDRPIVVICHAGIRSLNFANWLNDQEASYELWNLEGGIDAWSLAVDSDVPRY